MTAPGLKPGSRGAAATRPLSCKRPSFSMGVGNRLAKLMIDIARGELCSYPKTPDHASDGRKCNRAAVGIGDIVRVLEAWETAKVSPTLD